MVAHARPDSKIPHTRASPCPICQGYDTMPRGEGVRCGGFTSGDYAYCQREQYANARTPFLPASSTYRHRLSGNCLCGVMHGGGFGYGAPERPRSISRPHLTVVKAPEAPLGQPLATYTYEDAEGGTVLQVLRFREGKGKTFRQRRPDGHGGWSWNVAGVALVPYRLPELLTSDADVPVFVAEGEKDVDRLRAAGLVATCNPMGALKWRDELSLYLAGRHAVVIADNDPPEPEKGFPLGVGWEHAQRVAASLAGIAASVRVLKLPELPDGDVSDWLDAGGTVAQLVAWAAVWPLWQPVSSGTAQTETHQSGTYTTLANGSGDACTGRDACCGWKRTVQQAAANPAARERLATIISLDRHFRAREYKGLSVTEGYRISTEHLGQKAGCSRGTMLAAVKELAARGVLRYWQRRVRPTDKRPDGRAYGQSETHSMIAVPGGPDGFLARVADLPPEAETRGGRRTPVRLPDCGSCGSEHVSIACEDCGEVMDGERPARGGQPLDLMEAEGFGLV